MSPFVTEARNQLSSAPELWLLGLGSQYPPYRLGSEFLEKIAARFYDEGCEGCVQIGSSIHAVLKVSDLNRSIQNLLAINRKTGIETRASV